LSEHFSLETGGRKDGHYTAGDSQMAGLSLTSGYETHAGLRRHGVIVQDLEQTTHRWSDDAVGRTNLRAPRSTICSLTVQPENGRSLCWFACVTSFSGSIQHRISTAGPPCVHGMPEHRNA